MAKHVTLPHPYETTSDSSLHAFRLDHPRWTRQDVRVVILMAVAEMSKDLTNFLVISICTNDAVLQLVEGNLRLL